MSDWLQNVRVRLVVWWFRRRAVHARIVHSCGHVEEGLVLREWIEGRQNTACPRCGFYEALERMKKRQA